MKTAKERLYRVDYAEEKLGEERKQHRAVRGLHARHRGIDPAQIVHRVREQTVERRVTYHAGENCDAEDLQNCLNHEIEHDGEQALVIGKAVADGHRRVEQQAGDEQADEQQRE